MPRRSLLTATERESLLAFPESQEDLIRRYSFSDADLALIRQRRGAHNRLGFAVQMALLRYPGMQLAIDMAAPDYLVDWIAKQVRVDATSWPRYGERDETRREHLLELRTYLQLVPFGLTHFRRLVHSMSDLAMQTDKGIVLVEQALDTLRAGRIILPTLTVVERACAEAVTRANRKIHRTLAGPLQEHHRRGLDSLLEVMPQSHLTRLVWLRQSPAKPNSRYMKEHIERLRVFQRLTLPDGLGRQIHQNRLLKLAREGGQMQTSDLAKFEDERRYAILAALAIEGTATVTDELVDLHDRIMMKLFAAARNKHQQEFQRQGKAINDKVRLYSRVGRALVEAKKTGGDPFAAIEAILPWEEFAQSVTEADQLAQPEAFDHLHLVGEQYSTLRRYTSEFLDVLQLKAAPSAQGVLDAINQVRAMMNRLALANELPDAIVTDNGLKITPQDTIVPEAAQYLIDLTSGMLPRIKITELLMDVDDWTGFTRHFVHLKSGEAAKDRTLLMSAILADAINLGLSKMAESSPGASYAKLSWLQAWHIRDETYSAGLAELVNAQFRHGFAEHWGDGTTSSSDGQRFRAGGRAESTGHVNPKYGAEPGKLFYTHISDQYAPFSTRVVNVGVRDSTYVLDGLLYHESDLRIEEHYTDTAGFTDHVFALMHLLGFRFAPRIRDLGDTKLYVPGKVGDHPALRALIGGTLNIKHLRAHWDEILRLAASIKQGTVTASLMLRKLGSYPRQNGLAVALRELGRIERTLFILDWLQNTELRRRVHAGLNKGEARNALAKAIFIGFVA